MRGLAILLGFNFLGLLLNKLCRVPLPGNVIGLLLFTACLFAGWVKVDWVDRPAAFLLRHMLLFFAPFVVGVIAFAGVFRDQWPAVVLGIGGSLLGVLLVTGWTVTALVGKRDASGSPAATSKAGDA